MSKQILITGGAGFIGSNFVHYLRKERPDWNITVLDALTYAGNFQNIQEEAEGSAVEFYKGDVADSVCIAKLFGESKFDMVFHFAAETHVDRSVHDASAFVRTNLLGTQTLLDALLAQGSGRFVHVSTDEVYGSLGETGRFLETTPLDPTSPYAASKAGSDCLVLAMAKTHGLDALVTRCTNNYGPYQFPEKFIPLFITNTLEEKPLPLYGDGMNVRSWLHVEDHCRALLLIGEGGKKGEVYNIGGMEEAEIPNKEVALQIVQQLGKPESLIQYVTDRPAHDRRYAIDYTKINQEFGWKPEVVFGEGLKETIQWYLDNETWWKNVRSGEYEKFYEAQYASRIGANG